MPARKKSQPRRIARFADGSVVVSDLVARKQLADEQMRALFENSSEELQTEVRAASHEIGRTTTHEAREEALDRWRAPEGVSESDWFMLLTYVAVNEEPWALLPRRRMEIFPNVFVGIN